MENVGLGWDGVGRFRLKWAELGLFGRARLDKIRLSKARMDWVSLV